MRCATAVCVFLAATLALNAADDTHLRDWQREVEIARAIRERIVKRQAEAPTESSKPFTEKLPDGKVTFDMLPIPAGTFTMGSPATEPNRKLDEGPQRSVRINAFWMGRTEVTWSEFERYAMPWKHVNKPRHDTVLKLLGSDASIAVSHPTQRYVTADWGMGWGERPAINMTQFAARQYCRWLSARTGHFYRLPTEAEWEYACRAGTTTAYHFGDDVSKLGEYAWYEANSDWKYQQVGKKKPNQWGLHDMHGNIAEWVLDQYSKDYYGTLKGTAANPINTPVELYPRPARGGSWDHNPEFLRSAARMPSHPDWKIQDPQLPKSIWYHTDAQFLGMRIVRPLEVPSAEEMFEYWSAGRGNGE
jgi:formylglycine-generating enzyme required for sulfatase activity